MGQLFAMECDLCGDQQVKKKAFEILGKTFTENGVQKFCCKKCEGAMKAAFELKADGLADPLSKVAGLIEQRDKAERERDEIRATVSGDYLGAAAELSGHPGFGPRLGQSLPVIGMRPDERPRSIPHQPPNALPDRSGEPKKEKNPKETRRRKWKDLK
jgi:hypothetical protein